MTSHPVLVASCDNLIEPDGTPCPAGELTFRWGQQEAACPCCGAVTGISVANWVRVEPSTVDTAGQGEGAYELLRTGRKVGRTVYVQHGLEPSDDDPLVGVMDTPALAQRMVDALNGAELHTVQSLAGARQDGYYKGYNAAALAAPRAVAPVGNVDREALTRTMFDALEESLAERGVTPVHTYTDVERMTDVALAALRGGEDS